MGFLFGERSAQSINPKKAVQEVLHMLDSGLSFRGVGSSLPNIPEVRTAVNFVAETCATVPFFHVRRKTKGFGEELSPIHDSAFDRLFSVRTNAYQGPAVFFTELYSRLFYKNNVFVLPEWDYDTGRPLSLQILPFEDFRFEVREGISFVVFPSAGNTAFLYSDIVHLQRFPQSKAGERYQPILKNTDFYQAQQLAAIKLLETSGRMKALLVKKMPGIKMEDLKVELEAFQKNFLTAENTTGLGMMSGEYTIEKVDYNMPTIEVESRKNVLQTIYTYFNVSEDIITGKATELEYQQFANKCDPILTQTAQELTYKLFSDEEIRRGNRIYYNRLLLEVAALSAKSMLLDKAVYQGTITRNEARATLGLPWAEGGDTLTINKNTEAFGKGGENSDGSNEKSL